jgi:uncharacterized Tic20 family protein
MDRAFPSGDRNWAVAAHLTAALNLFSAPLPGLLGSFVTFMLTRDKSEFAREQAREALNLQLNLFLVEMALAAAMLISFFSNEGQGLTGPFRVLLCAAIAAMLGSVVLGITAAARAANGEAYRYPFIMRFVR